MNETRQLMPHQEEAINRLKPGSVLVGGVGTGKTRTALIFFLEKMCGLTFPYMEKDNPPKYPLYVITTAHKRDTNDWKQEAMLFGLGCRDDHTYVVDSWNNIEKYLDVEGAFFIFDEQRAVGSGVWAKTFVKIARKNKWIMLSATPGDTWMDYIPIFLANNFYKNRTEFIREHVAFSRVTRYPKVERYFGVHKLMKLRDQVLVFIDFQRNVEYKHIYKTSSYNAEDYRMVSKFRWNTETDEPIKDAAEYARVLRKLVGTDSSKLDILKELMLEHQKAIVFYNFNYELEMLTRFCNDNGIIFAEYNGNRHQTIPEGNSWLYLVQYTAGAEGWNCTTTDTVIFFSENYSYKIMTQAAGRTDRMTSPYSVLYYYHIRSDSSIDRAISQAIQTKKTFNESAFYDFSFVE